MWETAFSLLGLFAAAFGAATLLPFQSEIVLAGLLVRGEVGAGWLVAVASLGNTLGAVVNWAMGLGIERFRHRRWFPLTGRQLDRAQDWYRRWGLWSLTVSWAPYGDAVTVVAGIMRCPIVPFLAIVGAVKTARYALVALWLGGG